MITSQHYFLLLVLSAIFCYTPGLAAPTGTRTTVNRAASNESTSSILRLGLVDDAQLAQMRSDYPKLVLRFMPQIAAQKGLSGVMFKSARAWFGVEIQWVDVTPDALVRLQTLPAVPGTVALTGAQKVTAEKVIAALNGLKAATEVGVSQNEFSKRLIDAKTIAEAGLRALPESSLREHLVLSLTYYQDSLTLWDQVNKLMALQDEAKAMEREREDETPRNPVEQLDLRFKREKEDEERHHQVFQPLRDYWTKAETALAKAIELLPQNPP